MKKKTRQEIGEERLQEKMGGGRVEKKKRKRGEREKEEDRQ